MHRWPAILTQVIDSIYSANYALSYSRTNQSAKIDEGKQIIEKIAALKHDMSRDRPLEPIGVVSGKDAGEGPSPSSLTRSSTRSTGPGSRRPGSLPSATSTAC